MTNWLRAHHLSVFYLLAFGISWSGILIIAFWVGFDIAAPSALATGLFFIAMLLGPSLGGLVLSCLADGPGGLQNLRMRATRWKVGLYWYAIALFTAPILLLAVLLSLYAFAGPTFAPGFQWMLLAAGLIAGGFEEIGWTGFATPRLLARQGTGTAGLQLGLVWALWHALVVFLFTWGAMGPAWIWSFAIVYLATLVPYRVLMTWVYVHTQSVLVAMLMHASYTGWLLVLFPATSPAQNLIWQSAFAISLWCAAAAVLSRNRRTPIEADTGLKTLSDDLPLRQRP